MEDKSVSIKTSKKKIIISLIILLSVVVVIASYAIWAEYKKQTNKNSLITACLDIVYSNESNDINIEEMWPTIDGQAASLTPYTFSITNNCEMPVYYDVDMESVAVNGMSYIGDNYIKVSLDTSIPFIYGELDTIDNDTNTSYSIRNTKKIREKYIGPHATNTHEIRMWLDEDTPISEMNKVFKSKVKIMTSQERVIANKPHYTSEDCFTVNSSGVLTAYDTTNCPMNNARIIIPPEVDGITITEIGTQIFGTTGANTTGSRVAYIDISNMTGLTTIDRCPFGKNSSTNCTLNYNPDSETTDPLVIPYGVTTIGPFAFGFYKGTNTELVIPDTVTSIGASAFAQFNGDSIVFSKNLESIGSKAFNAWKGLAGNVSSATEKSPLILPDSITDIKSDSFTAYRGSYLKISSGLTSIPELAFRWYGGAGTVLEIPVGVTVIHDAAFQRFEGDDIIFPNGLTEIGGSAFEKYNDGPLNFPNTLVTLGDEAFSYYDYDNVTLPASVNEVGTFAFNSIMNDKTITILNPNPSSMVLGTDPFGNANLSCVGGACPW